MEIILILLEYKLGLYIRKSEPQLHIQLLFFPLVWDFDFSFST